MKSTDQTKSKLYSWGTVGRIGFTGIFFFWIYMIWISTADLNTKLNSATDRAIAVQNIRVDFKNEIQEWKDLLLRSTDKDTLDRNWHNYEIQYQKVTAEVQDIVLQSDPTVSEQFKAFAEVHVANRELYQKSLDLLIKSGFDSHQADLAVKGIDRPLIEKLNAAAAAMVDEKKRIDKGLVDEAHNKIEQNLFALAFLALLAVWMQKY